MAIPNKDVLIAEAREQTGLSDFGDDWFFGHIDALIPALNGQADLSAAGEFGARHMIVSALARRLSHVELLRQHPEILDEKVHVAALLTGLPRTGSTLFHRMLAATDGLTAVRWYEAQNYVPLPGETRGDPAPRKDAAKQILAYMLDAIPELMSIHPMSIDQPDEEVIILGQLFSSSMIEASYYVPDYAAWLSEQDAMPAYRDLTEILQSLQWQAPTRTGKSWVLKTPGHLMAMETALAAFPDAKVVMTHRDPVATVPSYCSMMASLYKLGSDTIDKQRVGAFWNHRLLAWLEHFMSVRAGADASRFLDINYADLLTDPVAAGRKALTHAGVEMSAHADAEMHQWLEENKRENRAAHAYTLDEFGLSEDQIKADFGAYVDAYL